MTPCHHLPPTLVHHAPERVSHQVYRNDVAELRAKCLKLAGKIQKRLSSADFGKGPLLGGTKKAQDVEEDEAV